MLLNQNNTRSQKRNFIVPMTGFRSSSGKIDHEWVENVKSSNISAKKLCHHVLTGRVKAHKLCFKNYECYHCAYDQMIDDENMDFQREERTCQ